jgi:predicted regulator of Ras-like GTPase activity (Roadblock/LC7/MglB family)
MVNTGKALSYTFMAAMEQLSPRPLEAALVSFDGLLYARYPVNTNQVWDEERENLSPMSAAMLSLGDRVTDVLRTGDLRETIICGTTGITITLVMDDEMVLSAKFPIVPSIDDLHSQLQAAIIKIQYRNPRDFALKTAVERLSPRPKMAAIISVDGLQRAIYPVHEDTYSELREEEYRIPALSAAMFSLGERITQELRNGELRETVVRGTHGIIMKMALGKDAILVVTFTSIPSLEDMRSQLLTIIDEIKLQVLGSPHAK